MSRRASRIASVFAGLCAASLAGCAGPQSVFSPASDQAQWLHGLFGLMLWVCGIAYLLVLAFLAVALWRARGALAETPITEPQDGRLQWGLKAWAALIVAGLLTLAVASFLVDRALAGAEPRGDPTVRVTGQQWWWRIEVKDPASGRWVESANELHLPLNQPTPVEVVSADVIHSFWIPNLSGKIDMVPGRVNRLTITPRQLGWVRGQCAEFCGLQHAQMALDVKVDSPADYAAWVARQAAPAAAPKDPVAARGLALVQDGTCGQCHALRGTAAAARAAPDLTHIAGRRFLAAGAAPLTRGSLQGWIAQPQALKPGAEMPATGLSPRDAEAVAHYLEGLT
jgi:cytochrome c oxidase subunit 2